MSTVNKAIILGRLGKDPEIRNAGNSDVANLSVATSEVWKDKRSGERQEKTEWHRITVWNEHAIKFIDEHLKKGDQVYIEGKIETRKYEKDGVDVYTTEIIVPAFGGEVKKIWERDGNGGGGDSSGNDRGGSRNNDRGGNDRGNDRGNGRSGSNDRGSDRGGSRGNDRANDRGGNDRGGSRGNDRDNGRSGNSRDTGRGGGGGRDNNDMDDDIPF